MEHRINLTGVAAELFAASWCNLDCTYCNIPKHNDMIMTKHNNIIKEIIEVTPVIDRLKRFYGDNLEIISHWGSEPTLTLGLFGDFYREAIKEFPNLNKISMSSNFMTSPSVISKFVLENLTQQRKFDIEIQMSLDGEARVTEVNRGAGTTEVIQDNIIALIDSLNQTEGIPHKVSVHFKSTMNKDQYHDLLEGDNLYNHYKFFDDLIHKMITANKYGNVQISINADPTVVCPDKYTKKDGLVLAEFYKKVEELRDKNLFKHVIPSFESYSGGFKRILNFKDELFTKAAMFTCSAGDSQFGISEYLHPCHDTFYLPYDGVQDAIREDMGRINSNREVENADTGRVELAKNVLTLKIDGMTQHDADKYQYRMRSFHDFTKFRLSYCIAMVMLMAKCGQVSKCYADPKNAEILAMVTTIRHSCPTGNQLYTGTMHLTDMAYFRLFGNGLVEEFVERALNNEL